MTKATNAPPAPAKLPLVIGFYRVLKSLPWSSHSYRGALGTLLLCVSVSQSGAAGLSELMDNRVDRP